MTEDRYFRKDQIQIVKCVGIILMIFHHLFEPEWMKYPGLIIDLYIGNVSLTSILAKGGNICIGIFAFISGYGWALTFDKKSKFSRIFGGGGIGLIGLYY